MKKFLATLVLLLAVTSCAASKPKTAGIKGEVVAYQRIGAVASHIQTTAGDTSSWQLDESVENAIKAKLSARYTIAPVDIDRATMRRLRRVDDALTFEPGPSVTQRLRAALKPGTPPVDAYLVLSAETAKDFIGIDNQRLTGLAIYRHAGSGLQIYAVGDFFLVDARSFRIIETGPLRLPRGLGIVERPYRRLDSSLARDTSWDQFTDAQQKLINAAFQDLLRDSLDFTVKDMKLAP